MFFSLKFFYLVLYLRIIMPKVKKTSKRRPYVRSGTRNTSRLALSDVSDDEVDFHHVQLDPFGPSSLEDFNIAQPGGGSSVGDLADSGSVFGDDSSALQPGSSNLMPPSTVRSSIVSPEIINDDSFEKACMEFELARRVPKEVLTLIRNKKFVPLAVLSGCGDITLDKADQHKLKITDWISAWNTFSVVHLIAFPGDGPHLFQYLEDIRLAAERTSAWEEYDIQFRKKMQYYPEMSFSKRDVDLWGVYVVGNMLAHGSSFQRSSFSTAASSTGLFRSRPFNAGYSVSSGFKPWIVRPSNQSKFSGRPRFANIPAVNSSSRDVSRLTFNPYNTGYCRFYNLFRRGCLLSNCIQKHLCPTCESDHPQSLCPVSRAEPLD